MNELQYGVEKQYSFYIKTCKPEHYMKKFQGFGISDDELERMNENGISFVMIVYMGKRGVINYLSTIKQWMNSEKRHVDTSNGSDDPQTFLSESEMWVIKI